MADDQAERLDTILRWLTQGKLTTDQAAAKVRTLHFPPPDHPSIADRYAERARADVTLPQHGSFALISAAYASSKIDRKQYSALADAAHQAMNTAALSQDGNYTGLGKVSHESVDYGDDKGTSEQHCGPPPVHGSCYMFDDETGQCSLVENVKPGGRCERWVPNAGQ